MDTYTTFYFYLIFLPLFFFFPSTTCFFHPYPCLLSPLSSLIHLYLFSASPFSSFKIFMFSHMKLLAQLLCLFFFIAFFSNSVHLLLGFPTINPIRLPQIQYLKPWFKAPPFNVAPPLILAAFQSFLICSCGFFF